MTDTINTVLPAGARAGDGNLPPLPPPTVRSERADEYLYFTEDQMRYYALAALAAAPAVSAPAWQPIETAPKDRGRMVLLFGDGPAIQSCSMVGSWSDDGWSECWMLSPGNTVFQPTHWMPLPAAPGFQGPVTGEQP